MKANPVISGLDTRPYSQLPICGISSLSYGSTCRRRDWVKETTSDGNDKVAILQQLFDLKQRMSVAYIDLERHTALLIRCLKERKSVDNFPYLFPC